MIAALGLGHRRRLLPEIIDGTRLTHPLTTAAAAATGLKPGTPVSLAYVDMVMTALGAGVLGGAGDAACSVIGSTGVHMRATPVDGVHLNQEGTGYVIALPAPGMVTQVQTNMATSLNIDWVLGLAADVMAAAGARQAMRSWSAASRAGSRRAARPAPLPPLYLEAGERGPFVNANARAGFVGLSVVHRYPDLVRAVIEGLGLAMRDCYAAMGELPSELRLSGGAARSEGLRRILAAATHAAVRVSARQEAGAAGAAMMAAVAIGAYPTMDACVADWVTPLLGPAEAPDSALGAAYDRIYPAFLEARRGLVEAWDALATARRANAECQAHAAEEQAQ